MFRGRSVAMKFSLSILLCSSIHIFSPVAFAFVFLLYVVQSLGVFVVVFVWSGTQVYAFVHVSMCLIRNRCAEIKWFHTFHFRLLSGFRIFFFFIHIFRFRCHLCFFFFSLFCGSLFWSEWGLIAHFLICYIWIRFIHETFAVLFICFVSFSKCFKKI